MDSKTPVSKSDNSNAPGTYPALTPSPEEQEFANNQSLISDQGTDDPTAPYAADPLNSGVAQNSAVEAPPAALKNELGGTGTILVHGILSEADYNPDLSGRERIRIYDQMRKGDATCRLGLSAVKYPILSAKWYIKPGDGEDDNGEKTTFVNEELFSNPNFSWSELLRQILLFCDYGHSFHEKVFRQRVDGKIGWKKFAARLPKTIYRYTLDDGETPGITQILPTGGTIQIPQWKLATFILDLEGSNYEGTSLLRAAYQPWFYKTLYYKIDSIATERQGMGVPIIKVPPQATPQDKAKAKVIAQNMRTNEQAYINLPDGFTIEYIDTKAKELKEVKEMVLHHDRQILKAFLAQFLDMGATSSGSRSLSDDQSELFLVSLQYVAKIAQQGLNHSIHEIVDLNFSNVKPNQYPTLEFGAIGQIDFEKFATALSRLSQGGVIVPDEDLERHVRNAMNLPEAMDLTEEDHEDLERRKVLVPPTDVDSFQVKKPVKYVNRESSFLNNVLALSEELNSALESKGNES